MSVATATKELLDRPVLKSAISKAARRLMPMLVILYVVSFLDRTNVGFAEAALGTDRRVSAGAFALGAGIFFIGYAIFEIPSNLLLKKVGAKIWLARIAITWGIVSACFAFVEGETSFIVLRFLLGVTEAGLFPGVIMFLAEWFPNKVRVQMFAIFYLAQPFSQMLGAPLSGWLINTGNQLPGVEGWQVMFFVEGLLVGVPWFFGIFACYFIGRAATTMARRRMLGTVLFTSTGLCIFGSAWAGTNHLPVVGLIFITLAVCSFLAVGPITWSYPTAFLTGTAAAAGIGLINSLGNLGGFVAPILRTTVNEITASPTGSAGVYALGILPFVAAFMMYRTRKFKNKADELLN